MRRSWAVRGLSVAVVAILFGRLAAAMAEEPADPPALPAVPDASARWEYRCVRKHKLSTDAADLEATLNELGQQGWRLSAVTWPTDWGYLCFERPKAPRLFSKAELRVVAPCRPACGSGLRCDAGRCVPMCQPACGDSQYCGSDAQCYWIREGRRTADPVQSK